ncbi:helix-turn-helix transcriptional regulator [Corynebacterium sp. AOP40-9SA-29]|uniref:helix-turn-helix transcriptional regulator n=1 Tax=Corynebacterium sp. AOP40-9SA-29 TaxID=3457677 RepID=UPI004034B361
MEIDREIRDFFMSRRARITPDQVGLPYVSGKRRVPGLRREEVAMLAGVSVEYYTRMERGRIGGASESVLDAVAKVLKLSEAERSHLYHLAQHASTPSRTTRRSSTGKRNTNPLDDSVRQVLESMTVPAIVQNRRLDLLAANDLGKGLYYTLDFSGDQVPNFARFAFLDPRAESFYLDQEQSRSLIVGTLRASAGRDPLDRELTSLIGELSACSSDFATRWARHDVHIHSYGRKSINHPVAGKLDLSYSDFALPGDPETSITTYTADPGSATADGLVLLSTWVQERRGKGSDALPHSERHRFSIPGEAPSELD